MPQQWRVVDCSSMKGKIYSHRGAVEICPEGQSATHMPVADVAVMLIGPHVSFSSAVLHRLLSEDISVLFTDWKGVPEGASYSWSTHGRVGARHRAQADLSLPRKKSAWARIIRAKVEGQAKVLELLERPKFRELRSLGTKIHSGDPHNIEAQAARIYWNSLWGKEEFRRLPGKAESHSRNSHLDYAYTVLRGYGIRAVLSAGLSPALSLFHHGRSNNFALVDDLIEPFRPAVDYEVSKLEANACMKESSTRHHLVSASSSVFNSDGTTIPSVLDSFAQHLGKYMEEDIKTLTVPIWNGPQVGS